MIIICSDYKSKTSQYLIENFAILRNLQRNLACKKV